MKKLVTIFLVVSMLLAAGCAAAPQQEAPPASASDTAGTPQASTETKFDGQIKIGYFDSLTGTGAVLGQGSYDGATLAVEQINAAGGVLGKELVLVPYDDKASPEEAVKNINRLLEVDKVDIILGSQYSGNIQAYGQIVEDAKMPTFGMGTSPVWLQQGWTYLFRAAINNSYSAISLASAYKQLGLDTTCIFHVQSEFGKSGKDTFLGLCEENNIEVLGIESMNSGDSDLTAQCSRIVELNPDAVYIMAESTACAPIVKQLRANGFEGYLFGEQLGIPEVRKVTQETSDLSIYATCYKMPAESPEEATTEQQKQFFRDYLARFGHMAQTEVAGKAYDAIFIMAEAIERAGTLDGTAIRDAVWTITDYQGLQGVYDYSGKDGEGIHATPMYIIIDGEDIPFDEYIASQN